jgi:hypothetical protein
MYHRYVKAPGCSAKKEKKKNRPPALGQITYNHILLHFTLAIDLIRYLCLKFWYTGPETSAILTNLHAGFDAAECAEEPTNSHQVIRSTNSLKLELPIEKLLEFACKK